MSCLTGMLAPYYAGFDLKTGTVHWEKGTEEIGDRESLVKLGAGRLEGSGDRLLHRRACCPYVV